jgi:hypothetical protein
MASLLYDVSATDPATLAAIALVAILTALLASMIGSRQEARRAGPTAGDETDDKENQHGGEQGEWIEGTDPEHDTRGQPTGTPVTFLSCRPCWRSPERGPCTRASSRR